MERNLDVEVKLESFVYIYAQDLITIDRLLPLADESYNTEFFKLKTVFTLIC